MIYLASPYSAKGPDGAEDRPVMEQRFEEACRAAAWYMGQGTVVFSPIAHCHSIATRHELPRGWKFWERFDREFIRRADRLVVLCVPGWRESVGVTAELMVAAEHGKPVSYLVPIDGHYREQAGAPMESA